MLCVIDLSVAFEEHEVLPALHAQQNALMMAKWCANGV